MSDVASQPRVVSPGARGLRPSRVTLLAVVMLLVCYAPTLRGMAEQWWNDADMGHGFLVLPVALWIVWRRRKHWTELPPEPSWWGLAVLLGAAAIHLAAALGAGLFAASVAFLVSVAGMILCLRGFRLLRAWAFPLLLCIFMLPKLAVVYNQMTLPLQLLASRMAAGILSATGLGVIREGNILDIAGRRVEVEAACSGIRYLLALGFLGVVVAYISDPKPWMRTALLAAAVPLSILVNAVRVAAAAAWPALDSETAHAGAGLLLLLASLAALSVARMFFNCMSGHRNA